MCKNRNDTTMKSPLHTVSTALLSASILIMASLSSCGTDGKKTSDTRAMAQRAYNLGIEDANAIISECHTETAIRVRLLDIRAKATNIKGRVSANAASDYLRGFRHGLEQHGDTLATTLFV